MAPIREELIGPARPLLLAVAGAVGLVLLIACANVANLLLARAAARRQSLAVRAALGASEGRLVRELMAESVLLALAGAAAGALLAAWAVRALASLAPATLPRRDAIAVDGTVLLFTLGIALATVLVFGLAPALHAVRVDVAGALRMRGGELAEGRRLRNGLVIAEVALSVMVVVAASLLARSFARLKGVDPGIDVQNVVSMDLSELPADAPRRVALMEELYASLASLPGVLAAGDTTRLPLAGVGGNPTSNVVIEGRPVPPGQEPQIDFRRASRDYFRAIGVPLVAGRMFTAAERLGSPEAPVAVINQAASEWLFPHEDPLGRRVQLAGQSWYTIVGVVGNVRHLGLHSAVRPEVYIHSMQGPPNNPQVVVRTSGDPASMAVSLRAVVRSADPNVLVSRVATMEAIRDESLAGPRFNTTLFGVFAALALVLGLVGVYGVLAYTVAQRTPEIGVRMALGAGTGDVLRLVVGHGLTLAAAGAALGVAGALAATRLLRGLLFEISPTDPATFAVAVLALLAAALLASSLPALRAARVDPLATLRNE
jgi:putative ABC transport system permease protein